MYSIVLTGINAWSITYTWTEKSLNSFDFFVLEGGSNDVLLARLACIEEKRYHPNQNRHHQYLKSNIYGPLTKRKVKMAGYWPTSSRLDRTSLVNKGFIIWDKTPKNDLSSCGTKREIPSGQDSSILSARVANHKHGIWFILSAHGASQCYLLTI